MKPVKVTIRNNAQGEPFLRIQSPNGKTLLVSESYDNAGNARRAAATLIGLAVSSPVVIRDQTRSANDGKTVRS